LDQQLESGKGQSLISAIAFQSDGASFEIVKTTVGSRCRHRWRFLRASAVRWPWGGFGL